MKGNKIIEGLTSENRRISIESLVPIPLKVMGNIPTKIAIGKMKKTFRRAGFMPTIKKIK